MDTKQLKQKLIKKHSYYANYCNTMKNYSDFLLSKKEVESGTHEDLALINNVLTKVLNSKRGRPYFSDNGELKKVIRGRETIEEYKASILKFGCVEATPRNSKEEEIQINYYYNAFVYAMTSIIGLVLFVDKDDKKKWDKEYAYVKKSIDYLEQISQELYGNDFRISPKWQYIKELCIVKRDKPVVYFGVQHIFTHYYPKTNPTVEEMLGWMDIADEILKIEREFDSKCSQDEKIQRERNKKLQEYKDELDKIYQEGCNEEKKLEKEEKEVPNKVHDYSVNFKFFLFVAIVSYVLAGIRIFGSRDSSSYIVYFIFIPSVFGVIYYFVKGFYYKRFYKQIITKKRHESYEKRERREEELRRAIELLEKMIFMNNRNETEEDVIKLYKFMKKNNPNTTEEIDKIIEEFTSYIKVADTKNRNASSNNKNKFIQNEKYSLIMEEYSRKEKLGVIMATLLIVGSVILGYTTIVYLIVALVASYGIYKAYKTNKQINANRVLFEENKSIKARIEKNIKTVCNHNIDVPFYGFTKVSDNVIDEIYHFFKDRKTEIEISMRTVKDSDVPYDEMDDESLCYAVEKSKEYDKLEKDGFSELQKIKAYGSVLERI